MTDTDIVADAPAAPETTGQEPAPDAVAQAVHEAAEALADKPVPEQSRLHALRKNTPAQEEFPFAVVQGKPVTELPKDLYIPPEALEVFLEAFEGPLDLLLYLIKRQNIDILEINVTEITAQYIAYVELMNAMQFELAAEYLLMAAMLAEIKSRMLLPRSTEAEEEGEDPRADLIRRLQEYERFKQAAEQIDELPREGRDLWPGKAEPPELEQERPVAPVEMSELLAALGEVLRRAELYGHHQIQREVLSTRERMSEILSVLRRDHFTSFVSLFRPEEGKQGVIVTFLAIMELAKDTLIDLVQNEAFGPIHVKARVSDEP